MQRYLVRIFHVEISDNYKTGNRPDGEESMELFLCHSHDQGYRLAQMSTVKNDYFVTVTVVMEYDRIVMKHDGPELTEGTKSYRAVMSRLENAK